MNFRDVRGTFQLEKNLWGHLEFCGGRDCFVSRKGKKVNAVSPSVKSSETAELWVVFTKIPFSFGFFLVRNV